MLIENFRRGGNCSASRGLLSDAEQLFRVTEFSIRTEQSLWVVFLAYSSLDKCIWAESWDNGTYRPP